MRFRDLAFTPDGSRLLARLVPVGRSKSRESQLRAWDADTWFEVDSAQLSLGLFPISGISPDGRWKAECGDENGGWGMPVRLYGTTESGKVVSLPTGLELNIQKIAFSADARRLIGGGWGEEGTGEVFVWDVPSGQRKLRLFLSESIFAVALSADGKHAAVGSSSGGLGVWNVESGGRTGSLAGHEGAVEALVFDATGRRLASASSDGTLRVWDLSGNVPVPRLKGHVDTIIDATFSPDGRRLVTVSSNTTTWLWDGNTGKPIACPHHSDSVVLSGGPTRNGIYVDDEQVVSLGSGTTWNTTTGEVVRREREYDRFRFMNHEILWVTGGRRFAFLSRHLRQLGISFPERLDDSLMFADHESAITCGALTPDGTRLAGGTQDGTIRVWDAETGATLAVLRGHEGEVTCVAFSVDGNRLVSSAGDGTARIWDTAFGAELSCLRIPDPGLWSKTWHDDCPPSEDHAFSAVAFAQDGRHILTLSDGDRLRLWDPITGECKNARQGITDLQAIANGAAWVVFLRGEMLEVEDGRTGTVVARTPIPRTPRGCRAAIPRPDGTAWACIFDQHFYFFALHGGA
jgi:WD40 repeat protein